MRPRVTFSITTMVYANRVVCITMNICTINIKRPASAPWSHTHRCNSHTNRCISSSKQTKITGWTVCSSRFVPPKIFSCFLHFIQTTLKYFTQDDYGYLLSEITLQRQSSGFGFRIVGGTEEGSQVAVGHIVPNGAADGNPRIATGDDILSIDGHNVVRIASRITASTPKYQQNQFHFNSYAIWRYNLPTTESFNWWEKLR